MEKNILTLRVDFGMRKKHSAIDIKVTHGERSKNFNFAEKLYVGGVPKSVILKWREKLPIIHGFQVNENNSLKLYFRGNFDWQF